MCIILPIILISIALYTLLGGMSIITKYTPNSRQRKALISLLSIWSVFFFTSLYTHITHFTSGTEAPSDILNFEMIVLGTIGFMTLLFYAAVTIYHKRITPYTSMLLILPIVTILIIYTIWSFITGTPINYKYLSYNEFKENIWSVPIILRITMLVLQFCYVTFITYIISKLIPIYSGYMEKTQSDMRYNLKWVNTFIISLYSICIAYIILTIHLTPITESIYFTICIFSFILIIDNAMYHKTFSEYTSLDINWTFRRGWEIKEEQSSETPVLNEENYFIEIERWMNSDKPYTNCNFSFNEMNEKYPDLSYNTLHEILSNHNHTFNSYVREHRINYATYLMDNFNDTLQFKRLYEEVGFSYYSSFSRAFSSVKGESPSRYRERINNQVD